MPNWYDTTFKCDNPAAVEAFMRTLRCIDSEEGAGYQPGAKSACVVTACGVPHNETVTVSKNFPDDEITCIYYFVCELYGNGTVYEVKYRNGGFKTVNETPNYSTDRIMMPDKKDQQAVHEKAIKFCRMLDVTTINEHGEAQLQWFSDEVTFRFKHEGSDGKLYRVEATKRHHLIDILVLARVVGQTTEWVPVGDEAVLKGVNPMSNNGLEMLAGWLSSPLFYGRQNASAVSACRQRAPQNKVKQC